MNRTKYCTALAAVGALAIGISACDDQPSAPADETVLLSVIPAGGATDVDPNGSITLTFSHVMHMDMYVAVHEGAGVSGPEVEGEWAWSDDRTQLTYPGVTAQV